MATCKKCGAQKRRWPRSCAQCRHGENRADIAAEAAQTAVETGAFRLIGRAITGVARLTMRVFD
ncbi:hypothetical protein [Streptomyces sp. NPDC013181]|uniref:hypothetical protein n=1 Tax=unclassified Streptomyces TaxID=2593676 RepID=UPI0036AA5577